MLSKHTSTGWRRLKNGPVRDILILGECDYYFVRQREDFADVIKLRILRWRSYPELSGWALNAITGVLREGDLMKYRRGSRQHKHGGRDLSDAVTGQGMLAAT